MKSLFMIIECVYEYNEASKHGNVCSYPNLALLFSLLVKNGALILLQALGHFVHSNTHPYTKDIEIYLCLDMKSL